MFMIPSILDLTRERVSFDKSLKHNLRKTLFVLS